MLKKSNWRNSVGCTRTFGHDQSTLPDISGQSRTMAWRTPHPPPALYFRLSRLSCVSWLCGNARQVGLGSINLVTLAEARELACDARRLLLHGRDPVEERRAQRRASAVARAKPSRRATDSLSRVVQSQPALGQTDCPSNPRASVSILPRSEAPPSFDRRPPVAAQRSRSA